MTARDPQQTIRYTDEHWMRHAIGLAGRATSSGEVPVGAVLVKGDTIIGDGWNSPIASNDPSAHAEMIALRAGGLAIRNYRLLDTTLYVTLEPCVMCMGAIIHARVKRLVFGARDPKRGAVCSALQLANVDFLNHRVEYTAQVLEEECSSMLKAFFRERR